MAEEGDRIEMSQRERDRLRVLRDVKDGWFSQVKAAELLKLTVRQLRRLQRGGLGGRGQHIATLVVGRAPVAAATASGTSSPAPAATELLRGVGADGHVASRLA